MAKQNLRALIENIVIEALEEWMDECECDDLAEVDSKAGVKAFGDGKIEKMKNEAAKKQAKSDEDPEWKRTLKAAASTDSWDAWDSASKNPASKKKSKKSKKA